MFRSNSKSAYIYGSFYYNTNMLIPLELNTPTGLGAFLSNSTLKSIGMSLHSGGLYSYYNMSDVLIHVCMYSDFTTYPSVVSQYFTSILIIYKSLCQPVAQPHHICSLNLSNINLWINTKVMSTTLIIRH